MKGQMKIFLLLLLGPYVTGTINYARYEVLRTKPVTYQDLKLMKQFVEMAPLSNFWTDPNHVGDIDVMVPPELKKEFKEFLSSRNIEWEVLIEDVQKLMDIERGHNNAHRLVFGWTRYASLAQIESWLYSLAKKYKQVEIIIAGTTFEGRNITGVRLSYSWVNQHRAIFIEANIHAREWISSAVATFILNQLLTSKDPAIRKEAERYDWYIIPVANPDGFAFSHEEDRMWRKTRSKYFWPCRGVDPNRNWDNHWSELSVSVFPCSDKYPGPKPFSEISTRTMSEYIRTIGHKLLAYLSFHSYGQVLGIPYSHSPEPLDNFNLTFSIRLEAVKSLEKRYGTKYKVGNIYQTMYPCSGISLDWVKATFKTPLVYLYELGHVKYGFLVPPDQIIPTGQETLDSIVTILQKYREKMSWFW
ncbi:zinc carboxypeptidase-like [Coccinella septempunctata]|uniref:zinc carboxypeptidase-like n=1 Tax=Coccinella septempunctata TaxID=41139 RepID=UPI001D072320|nr:zinc carboxypeptidase-like [Coccinella septempunctata]